ncbi:MAG: toxin [Deltaproteobacteria bacterium]|nr:toxin [Deltaproteobacteria bacterium]
MRASLIAVLAVAIPSVAHAEPPLVVWQNRVLAPPTAGVAQLTPVSHKLYLNDCQPNGCTVSPGSDNSLTNRSSIPQSAVTLDAYSHGQAHWDELVACVRETFKPFDIEIVTENPGTEAHFEVMIGGTSRQLNPNLDAGGVAPFISCGAARDNAISFVFAGTSSSVNYLCGAVAQEACHVWGLDHELDAKDPMTYLDLGSLKRFQNNDASCGESDPRGCRCGGETQNSFRYMNETFGLSPAIAAPALVVSRPTEGQWVKPNFPINATLTSELDMMDASLAIDGDPVQSVSGVIAFNAPALSAGHHEIAVAATDTGDRTASVSVNVNVMGTCSGASACADSFHCLGGFCLPGANQAGGLGATCVDNAECATGRCASDGTDSLCTGECDGGATCPGGFTCVDGANVCWPSPDDGGGCATTGGNPCSFLIVGLGALGFVVRRRRR